MNNFISSSTPSNRNNESGNVLFILLIAIALFVALSYVVSKMLSQETIGKVTAEKSRLLGDEMIDLGSTLRQVIQDLRISNDCALEDISFDNNIVSGYEHVPVTSDKCRVYGFDGGAMSYFKQASSWGDESKLGDSRYGEIIFSGNICVADLPDGDYDDCNNDGDTSNEELIMIVPYINKEICLEINNKIGIDNPSGDAPIDADCSWGDQFIGEFEDGQSIGNANGNFKARMQGCYRHNNSCSGLNGSYHFYQVLSVR